MLVAAKPSADFSLGHSLFATHLTIRESTRANATRSKDERGR
jgi:hypothetical protein